ncbi:MAG: hypothetical protein JRE23_00105 [Deltaproteobacteria bacterium]|nr:hypothetical protein [Deltaproteobacteria bacterium]
MSFSKKIKIPLSDKSDEDNIPHHDICSQPLKEMDRESLPKREEPCKEPYEVPYSGWFY